MRHCLFILGVLSVAAGCGRTQSSRTTTLDARLEVEARLPADASTVMDGPLPVDAAVAVDGSPGGETTAGVDAAFAYPAVDDGKGGRVIDPDYVFHNFNALLEGTWLVGWYGGQNRLSWIRFEPTCGKLFENTFRVLSTVQAPSTLPYWDCSGPGIWNSTARPASVDLSMPAGCEREILIFESFLLSLKSDADIAQASLSSCRESECSVGIRTQRVARKFPDSVCNADFTACGAPF